MITFRRIVHYESQPDHPAHCANLYLGIGRFHILAYTKPHMGVDVGWNCKFWHTKWHLRIATDGVRWTWNKTWDEV